MTSSSFELPEVSPHGYETAADAAVTVIVTLDGLSVEGEAIVPLTDGRVAPEDKEGGAMGIKIPRLTLFLSKLRTHHIVPSLDPPLLIGLDRRVPYQVLIEVLYSAKQKGAGFHKALLMAHAGVRALQLPLVLADRAPSAGTGTGGGAPPLQMFVSITKQGILVWSASGLEGTLKQPKATIAHGPAAPTELTRVLAEIVKRRWATAPRPAADRAVVLQAELATPMQVIAEVLGAMRADPAGAELFPEIRLSSGFE